MKNEKIFIACSMIAAICLFVSGIEELFHNPTELIILSALSGLGYGLLATIIYIVAKFFWPEKTKKIIKSVLSELDED